MVFKIANSVTKSVQIGKVIAKQELRNNAVGPFSIHSRTFFFFFFFEHGFLLEDVQALLDLLQFHQVNIMGRGRAGSFGDCDW